MSDFIQGGGNVTTNEAATQKPFTKVVKHKATKGIPEGIARKIKAGTNTSYLEDVAHGLSYYDKDAGVDVPMSKMTLVVLQVCAKLEGTRKSGSDKYVNAYSNYVRDTRVVPFKSVERVGDQKQTIFSGFYSTFKDNKNSRNEHIKWTTCLICYCIELKEIVEVKSAFFANALCDATAKATGKKEVKVFDLSRYVRYEFECVILSDKYGGEWNGGEAFIAPKFKASGVTQGKEFIDAKFQEVKLWLDAHEDYHLENFKPQTAEDKMKVDITASASNKPQSNYDTPPSTDTPPSNDDLPF